MGNVLMAQVNKPVNGIADSRNEAYAFTNATIFKDYQTKLENATLLVKKGKIVAVGNDVKIPAGYIKIDLSGKSIYPSFIDLHTQYGLPKPAGRGSFWSAKEQIESAKEGAYNANQAVKAEFSASEAFKVNKKQAEELRKAGIGAVLTFRADGVVRGTSTLVTLAEEEENDVMLKQRAGAHYAFDKGTSTQMYPVSIMGYVALLRQTYLDASWYQAGGNQEVKDLSLDAFIAQQSLPQFFDASDLLNVFRADKVANEFGVNYIIKGDGKEYQRIEALKKANTPLIVPVSYPEAYDVTDPYDAIHVSYAQMKDWELSPANLGMLEKAGIEFAITSADLKKPELLLENVRKAVKYGLSETAALKGLTYTPSKLLRAEDQLGSLNKGNVANFLIASGNIFEEGSTIHQNWVQGHNYELSPLVSHDYAGTYKVTVGEENYAMVLGGTPEKPTFQFQINDSTDLKTKGSLKEELITLNFAQDTTKEAKWVRLSGWVTEKGFKGEGQDVAGNWIKWEAMLAGEKKDDKKEDKKEEEETLALGEVIYPFNAYGQTVKKEAQTTIFQHATVWTNEAEGILEDTDVMVKDGKIVQVGKGLSAEGAVYVDATGKHLTSGIIDEHSHIALSAVNDVAVMSSMVRMEDAVDPDDVNIYRQLSGGVTAAQLLHGSANPVGGQSALIKLRWGKTADEMLIEGADGFIKFALGENVKRSSWASSIRYPRTRMGVEQVYRDGFTRAKAYAEEWAAYNALSKKEKKNTVAPRRDLQLEALVEIMTNKRFISCHSYVQSEINMLMKVAEDFDFRVNTFTHILEGYKVADKMKEHGVGASTFADWWAYKFEVYEAIPYNAALMTEQGVTTAINSDDAEMARRLNQEAAKTVKYGGMSEEEAWKMVTLNPAKLLHLDDHMGSIKVGKDADLVLWSANPLSIYAKAEKTIIDGVVYFDIEEDQKMRAQMKAEKARLTQEMKDAKKGGAKTRKASPMMRHHFHCDDL
ncbi:amidohydrolase family protein [Algivirga pacifica]|uniref:Amidohydrolase family protein n=2 Tax=Algivirga pacifica TaxID=1162670 RepID=A0ABP9D818_9BACT